MEQLGTDLHRRDTRNSWWPFRTIKVEPKGRGRPRRALRGIISRANVRKYGQSSITCFAVSHCHSQGQAGDLKPGTLHLCRKAARLIFPVWICQYTAMCLREAGVEAEGSSLYGIFAGF